MNTFHARSTTVVELRAGLVLNFLLSPYLCPCPSPLDVFDLLAFDPAHGVDFQWCFSH